VIDLICDFDKENEKLKLYHVLKNLKGKNVIQIKKYRKTRSTQENRYYWKVIVGTLAMEFGYTEQEMHFELKRLFLSYQKPNIKTGELMTFMRSTTDLDTMEAEVYYEQIRVWALAEFTIFLPLPNEIVKND